jgi:hypothetical protein
MKIFGQHEEQTLIQFEHARKQAVDAALMADGHGLRHAHRWRRGLPQPGIRCRRWLRHRLRNAAIRTDLTLDALGSSPAEIRATLTGIADRSPTP